MYTIHHKAQDHEFHNISELGVKARDWEDGPTTYHIRIQIVGEKEIAFGEFGNGKEADQYFQYLKGLISNGNGAKLEWE